MSGIVQGRHLRLAAFLVGAAFFSYLIARTGPGAIARDLAQVGWAFLPIVLVWGGVYLSNTVSWLILLRAGAEAEGLVPGAAATIPPPRAFAITVSAFAVNYITPLAALGGEPLKAAAAAGWVGARRAAASVLAFRIVHTLGQLAFWAATIPVAWVIFPPDRATRTILAVAGALLVPVGVGILFLFRARALERALDALGHRGGRLGRLAARLEPRRPALAAVDDELAAMARRPAPLALALAVEAGGRFLSAYEFVLVARAVGASFGYADAVAAACVSQVVMNVLFFVPFEAGTREAGILLVSRLLGLTPGFGVYAAIVTRLREITWIGIGLLLIWATGERRKRPLRAPDRTTDTAS